MADRRILFVDDDEDFLEMIESVVHEWAKGRWEVVQTNNTGKALKVLQQSKVDLLISDLDMPVLDGRQLLKLVRKKNPSTQVVILTSFVDEKIREDCTSHGAELVLQKPKSIAEMESLLMVIEEVASVEGGDGFEGVMNRVGLQDILQLECLNRKSSVLHVSDHTIKGKIFIRDGAIIHAQCGSLSGIEAFNFLLSLDRGQFNNLKFQEPPEETIEGSWEFLIMEASRLKDEGREETVIPSSGPGNIPDVFPVSNREQPRESKFEAEDNSGFFEIEDTAEINKGGLFPRKIDEMLVCSKQGNVLYEWECGDTDQRAEFLNTLSSESCDIGEALGIGKFSRLEIVSNKSRALAQVKPAGSVYVRSSNVLLKN